MRSKGLGPGPQRTLLPKAMSTFSLLFPVPVVGSKKRKIAYGAEKSLQKLLEIPPKDRRNALKGSATHARKHVGKDLNAKSHVKEP